MTNSIDTLDRLASHAEAIANDAEKVYEIRDVGDQHAQGDLLFTRITKLPAGAKEIKNPPLQLAPGATQGSRHCLRSLDGVKLYAVPNAGPFDGPVIVAERGCAVDHPEHGNVVFPAGIEAVTYQRASEVRRVID